MVIGISDRRSIRSCLRCGFLRCTLGHDAIPERLSYTQQPSKLPVVLSADEVVRFLEAIPSLKNHHCPKCQGLARAEWLARRQAELLRVPYFHVVFTLPMLAGEIAFQNKANVYAILFRAVAEALTTIAADPRHLGAQIGVTAVLDTWCQTLQHHPHIRYVVPSGPALDGTRWIAYRPGFFLPARVLSRLFRRLFLQNLQDAFEVGKLRFFGKLAGMAKPTAFATGLDQLRRIEWVVYAKPPFGGPEQVLAYLGR